MDKSRIHKHNAARLVEQKFKLLSTVIKDREAGKPLDKYLADGELREAVARAGTIIEVVLDHIVKNVAVKKTVSKKEV